MAINLNSGGANSESTLYDDSRLHRAICDALSNSLAKLTESEPQLVARLAVNIPKEVGAIGNFPISSSSIFVHQRPYVKYTGMSSKKIEVGDLLLIRTLKRKDGTVTRTALLLQAKKSDFKNIANISQGNQDQHDLYAYWPKFTFASSPLKGQDRFVRGPNMQNGSQYLILPKNSPSKFKMFCHRYCCEQECMPCCNYSCSLTAFAPPSKLSRFRCFYVELIDFILGNAGRTFQYQPCDGSIGWSQFITDLIIATNEKYSKKIKTMEKAGGDGFRKNEIMFFSLSENFDKKDSLFATALDDNGDEKQDNIEELINQIGDKWGEQDGGISTIEFIIDESKIDL